MIRVNELTSAEKRLWAAFPEGREVDLRVGDPDEDDPAQGAGWGPERIIRAEVIRSLLLGARKETAGEVAAVRVLGARVDDSLNLDYAEFEYPLRLTNCSFAEPVSLVNARTRRVNLAGSHLVGLSASRSVVDGRLILRGCTVAGEIRLVGTHVTGDLDLTGAHLANPTGAVLTANRLRVGDDLVMTGGFVAEGSVLLRGASVGGDVDLRDARLWAPGGEALNAARLQVGIDLLCDRMTTTGEVQVSGADVKGVGRFAGARLTNPGGLALCADHLQIGADLQFHQGFRAEGEIRMKGVHVDGRINFDSAVINADNGVAVDANSADIVGSVYCTGGFEAIGKVRFAGARIGGVLSFRDATLRLSPSTSAGAASPSASTVLSLGHVRADEIYLRTRTPPGGVVNLAHATARMLSDSPDSWPDDIRLDGFAYETLETPGSAERRIGWLERERAGYLPQPYEQLATVYRRMGHEGDARKVLLAKQRTRRKTLPRAARLWGIVQEAAVGYGYRPERAVAWLVVLLAIGTTVFDLHHPAPTAQAALPAFNPLIYSLDLLLPVVNFGQSKAFTATGGYQWLAYALTAAGWVLATAIAAGLARAVNRT